MSSARRREPSLRKSTRRVMQDWTSWLPNMLQRSWKLCSAVGQALTSWGQHCDAATARLAACRGLLRLRRDDLRRLWMTARTHHYALQMLTDIEEVTDAYLQDITPEFEASLTDEDKTFETTVMISLEALGVLDQLKEATEKFKVQIQHELLEVIDSVSRRIIEEGDDVEIDPESDEEGEIQDTAGVTETGRPLARLVTILAEELLQLWRAALQKHRLPDSCLHTELHYWSAVQQVSVTLAAARAPGAAPYSDQLRVADYFGKKRPQRRRTDLFKLTEAVNVPYAHSLRTTCEREKASGCLSLRAQPSMTPYGRIT
ncbi:Exocyst complex component 4, partial [Operophtera brumata]